MAVDRRFLFLAASLAVLVPVATSQAEANRPWDGVWKGSLEHVSPLVLRVANGKVVSYSIAGSPVAIHYSQATPTTFSFGDRDHFGVVLTRTSDNTAAAKAHGRNGFGSGVFTKE